MALHRIRVGLNARHAVHFTEADYELIRRARIETLRILSLTDLSVYRRLRQENPDLEFIVRLYDDRIARDSRPSPSAFVARMVPVIEQLRPYATKFEIHNEPNYRDGLEGWGSSDESARAFLAWYMPVLRTLKQLCPWAEFGFPGLAPRHRDLFWLEICQEAVHASDWLGCHCYWQYDSMKSEQWGMRFTLYHERFPDKRIEITEFANATPSGEVSAERIAVQYVNYYQELSQYPYLGSACAFIASSPEPQWEQFVWMEENGRMRPVVEYVGDMDRKPVEVSPLPSPSSRPTFTSGERFFPQTGKTVRGNFLKFFENYGPEICGYPISDPFDDHGIPTQYFQRLALEELPSGRVRLKMIGTEAWQSRQRGSGAATRDEEPDSGPIDDGSLRPLIIDLTDSLPRHATKSYPQRALSEITQIVIHHTATSPAVTPQRLAEHCVRRLGRAGIIYHFIVAANGTIYQTNRLETVSDHAFERNVESVGICFPGNFTRTIPTEAQLKAGARLCAWLLQSLHLPLSRIVGVGEFGRTQSPGKQWLSGQRWKDKLLHEIQAVLRGSGQVSAPVIEDLTSKLLRHPTKQYESRSLSEITTLVIHHSATGPTVRPERIAEYHVKRMDWPGIGYHFLVSAEGILYQTNSLETISYHATRANPYSLGICFLGNFTEQIPTPPQLQAGAHLVAWLMQELNIPLENVDGHMRFTTTACPGHQWLNGKKWKELLYQEIRQVQGS